MDDVTVEHRLTRIEEQQRAGFERMEARVLSATAEIEGIKIELRRMNGSLRGHQDRLIKLETSAPDLVTQHRQMWQWFSAGRWFAVAWMLAILGANAADLWHLFVR